MCRKFALVSNVFSFISKALNLIRRIFDLGNVHFDVEVGCTLILQIIHFMSGVFQKNFMGIAADIVRRDTLQREAAERRRSSRRWSLIGIGAAALVGVGAIIGTRVLLAGK